MAWTFQKDFAEERLPPELLARANLRGNEYAWRVEDIPALIETAKSTSFASLGGQLQLRIPGGATGECYWVEVDNGELIESDLPWQHLVTQTADQSLSRFKALQTKYGFSSEARTAFAQTVDEFEGNGGVLEDALWFVWYLVAKTERTSRPPPTSPPARP